MKSPKDEKKNTNQYYSITEEDFSNGEIKVFSLKDGRHLYALKYGEDKDNIAIIALATIDAKHDKKETRKKLVNRIVSLKVNPEMRDITLLNDMENTYQKNGFSWTSEGKELLSESIDSISKKSILKTVEYNEDTRTLGKVKVDKTELEKQKKMDALDKILREMKNNDEKTGEENIKRFQIGQQNFFKIASINSQELPNTYEEAKEIRSQLTSMDGFDEKSIIAYMKENDKDGVYREYLELKEAAIIREKWKTLADIEKEIKINPSEQLKEYLLYTQDTNQYILTNGEEPKSFKNEKDKREGLDSLLEGYEVPQEDIYIKETKMLLKVSDNIKTKLFNDNGQQIKFFLSVMQQSGFNMDFSSIEMSEIANNIEDKEKYREDR